MRDTNKIFADIEEENVNEDSSLIEEEEDKTKENNFRP